MMCSFSLVGQARGSLILLHGCVSAGGSGCGTGDHDWISVSRAGSRTPTRRFTSIGSTLNILPDSVLARSGLRQIPMTLCRNLLRESDTYSATPSESCFATDTVAPPVKVLVSREGILEIPRRTVVSAHPFLLRVCSIGRCRSSSGTIIGTPVSGFASPVPGGPPDTLHRGGSRCTWRCGRNVSTGQFVGGDDNAADMEANCRRDTRHSCREPEYTGRTGRTLIHGSAQNAYGDCRHRFACDSSGHSCCCGHCGRNIRTATPALGIRACGRDLCNHLTVVAAWRSEHRVRRHLEGRVCRVRIVVQQAMICTREDLLLMVSVKRLLYDNR